MILEHLDLDGCEITENVGTVRLGRMGILDDAPY